MNTITPAMQVRGLTLQNRIRKLVPVVRSPREVCRQKLAGFADRVHDRVGEILGLKMGPHCPGQSLPKRIAAPFVHPSIANDGKLLRARGNEDEDAIALPRLGHSETLELLPGLADRVGHFAMLNEDANFARGRCFRAGNRLGDAVMFQLFDEVFCSHNFTSSIPRLRRRNFRPRRQIR